MGDRFTITCEKCKEKITFTVKTEKGKKIPNPEKPGKFKWNPPVDEDGERHSCGGYKTKKLPCSYCQQWKCACTHTKCHGCGINFGWFRDGTGDYGQHLKEGGHYDNHGMYRN
jgi:hypothetical protein